MSPRRSRRHPRQESMSLPRRPDADPAALLAGLDRSLAGLGLTEVGEGFDNIAYAVRSPSGARLLLRVSKVADPVERARVLTKDVALLEFANRHSSLTTNEVIAADAHAGALLLTEVTGRTADQIRPTDRAAFAETMATFLTRLHTAPVVEAALVTEMDPRSAAQWLVDTATAWAAVADRTPVTLRDRVDEFLVGPAPNDVRRITFCHNDLGDEHVVLSEDGGHVRGVIDWSDAVLGDPARDLGLLTLDFGPGIVDALIDDYHGPTGADFRGRVLWFAATAGVEGLAWRLANARPWQVTADRLHDVLAVLA